MLEVPHVLIKIHSVANDKFARNEISNIVGIIVIFQIYWILLVQKNAHLHTLGSKVLELVPDGHHAVACIINVFHDQDILVLNILFSDVYLNVVFA